MYFINCKSCRFKPAAFYIFSTGYHYSNLLISVKDKNQMMQMEKLVKQYDMELMKMAMLKHEETFRQQVHDLHRLYRIQKQLMSDLTRPSERSFRQQRRGEPRRELNLQLPVHEYVVIGRREATPSAREDELALTLAVGDSRSRRKRREGTPFASDCSGGGSLTTSSSADSDAGALRAVAFDLQEGMMVKQPTWLVQCLSLRMA